jgi:hypothetical protein
MALGYGVGRLLPGDGGRSAPPRRGQAITAVPGSSAIDELEEYAKLRQDETGVDIPKTFSCRSPNAEDVPNQTYTPTAPGVRGPCIAPNVLNGECYPGSHFQVLRKTKDAVAVAHCRKVGLPEQTPGQDFWNDIAIIQYNKANGATCFYQALGSSTNGILPGTDVPSPKQEWVHQVVAVVGAR